MKISKKLENNRRFYAVVITLISVFYVLLVLAVNSALIDLVVSDDPQKGLKELDRASRVISSIALGLPATLFLLKLIKIERFGKTTYIALASAVFIMLSGFLVAAQRNVIEYFVDQTDTKQRSAAIGALIGIHALSNGALEMESWGLPKIDKSNAQQKTAAIYIMPFLAMSGRRDDILDNAGAMLAASVYRNNDLKKPVIISRLGEMCSETKNSYASYIVSSKKIADLNIGKSIGETMFKKYRDDYLGYIGTLQYNLPYSLFIDHFDIQLSIRQKLVDVVDDYSMSTQLEYIFPKDRLKTYMMQFFDRKFIDPCMSWDDYVEEYLIAISDDLGSQATDLVVDQNMDVIPNKKAIDDIGAQAVYAVVVPPSGIAWSLLAATFAVCLILFRVVSMVTGQKVVGAVIGILFAMAIWYMPFQKPNQYMDNANAQEGFIQIADTYSQPVASVLEWSIRAAPMIYPLGRISRDSGIGLIFGLNVID